MIIKKRKLFSMVLSLMLGIITFVFCCDIGDTTNGNENPEEEIFSGGIPIDMYLIGDQFNAIGETLHEDKLTETFENVGCAGQGNLNYATRISPGINNVKSFNQFYWEVTAGYGVRSDKVGLEYGLAKVLNTEYQTETKAFIFKSAF